MSRWPDGWTEDSITVDGRKLYFRRSRDVEGAVPIVHVHGFGISGSYLMPTAQLLTGHAANVVLDLPGYGRSPRHDHTLGIEELAAVLLSALDGLGYAKATLVGNSMGCPISLEVAHNAPERVHRLVLVSPAGGVHNQPLVRGVGQLARDVAKESPRMFPIAVPDYLHFGPMNAMRLFRQLTEFPSLERLLNTPVPSLAVLGDKDPLMPPPHRVREVGRLAPEHIDVVLIRGAAHAINFSHPGELAHVIMSWLEGRPIEDDPNLPGRSSVLHVRN